MKNSTFGNCLLITLALLVKANVADSQDKMTITGLVGDDATHETLVGASVLLKNTTTGTVTGVDGKFSLSIPATQDKVLLQVSYVGYETQDVAVSPDHPEINVSLRVKKMMAKEVVVSASRVSERILESPVSIEKTDALAISQSPAFNFYESAAQLKSVDVVTSSLTYKNINLRGFGNTEKPGFIQMIDGVDNQAPGLNYAVGYNIVDLDVENTEIIPGAASALYGANAYNGVMSITSRNPFKYQGLSLQVKNGLNHIEGSDHVPAALYDIQGRYARSLFSDKLAFKVTGSYFSGQDWMATDYRDVDVNTPASMHGSGNLSYDGLNIYGDEVAAPLPIGPGGSNVYVSRTGYEEKDLVDYKSRIVKVGAGLHYKIGSKTEISYGYNYSLITTVLHSANRYSLKDFGLDQQGGPA